MIQVQKKVVLTYFKTTFLLMITFFLGVVLATGVARLLEKSKDKSADNKPDPTDFHDVFVLKNTVRKDKEVLPENIIVIRIHKDEVPEGVVKTYQQIDGRTVRSEIPRGMVLLDEFFDAKIARKTVDGFLPPGYFSVGIRVREVVVAGQSSISSVFPGDQVDIIVVQKNTKKEGESDEFVLLEKIPVIDMFWDRDEDFRRDEKKGTVSLLLSDSQRKNLEEKCQGETKIRLRICPPTETQVISMSQPQNPVERANSSSFYQTADQPPLISDSLNDVAYPIEIVFRNKQELKPIQHNELQTPSFRGVPEESYGDKNAKNASDSVIGKLNSATKPDSSLPVPRYSSFYDIANKKGNSNMRWRTVVPQSPLVFELRPNSMTQARGIYQENGVYYSVE